jgi:PAS domain S-box-containing protein
MPGFYPETLQAGRTFTDDHICAGHGGRPVRDDRKTKKQLIGELRELREQLDAANSAKVLRESEDRFRTLFENAPLGYQSLDAEGNFIEVNETWCKKLGYGKEEVIGRNFSEFIRPDYREVFKENFPKFKGIGYILGVEFEMIRKDGSEIIVSFDGRIGRNGDGSFRQTYCVFQDITGRKRAEEELRTKTDVLDTVFESAPYIMMVVNGDGRVENINRAGERFAGGSKEALLGLLGGEVFSCFNSFDGLGCGRNAVCLHCPVRTRVMRTFETGEAIYDAEGRMTVQHAGGPVEIDLLISTAPIRVNDFDKVLVTIADITERKRAEEALREAEWKFKALFENSPIGVAYHRMIYDETGRPVDYYFIDANENFREFTGVDPRGKRVTEAFPGIENDPADWVGIYGHVVSSGEIMRFQQYLPINDNWYEIVAFRYAPDRFVTTFINITEQKLAREALSASEKKYRSMFDSSPIAIWEEDFSRLKVRFDEIRSSGVTDFRSYFEDNPDEIDRLARSVKIVEMNEASVKLLGGESKEQIANDLTRYFTAKSYAVFREEIIALAEGRSYFHSEIPVRNIKGETIVLDFTVSVQPGHENTLSRVLVSFIDITERKEAEVSLRQSEERQKIILDSIQAGILLIDAETHVIVDANPVAAHIIGVPLERLLGTVCNNHICPADIGKCPITDLGQTIDNSDRIIITAGGQRRSIVKTVAPIVVRGRRHLLESFIDITDRKISEEALKTLSLRQKAILASVPDIIVEVDNKKVYTWANEAGLEFFGEDVLGREASYYFEGEQRTYEVVQPLFAGTEDVIYVESWQRRRDGERRLLAWWCKVLKDEKGNVEGGISTARDITESKLAEEALRRSEAELHDSYFAQATINMILSESLDDMPLELILQKALNMMLSVPWLFFEPVGSIHLAENDSGVLVMKAQFNLPEQLKEACAKIAFGQCLCGKAAQTQEILFADRLDERHDTHYEEMQPHGHYIVPILSGSRTLGVIDIYLKEGHVRDRREESFLHTIAGTLAGIIIRKQAEVEGEKLHAQLLQSQKMEAVGHLAGGIAHDFNNILTAIMGFGYILTMKIKEGDPLRLYPERILTASEKAIALTRGLLTFSRKQITDPRPVNMNQIITEADKMFLRIIGEDVEVQLVPSEEDIMVMADPNQMEQALMNLVMNARDAMPDGGLLTIKNETVEIDAAFIREHGFGSEGKYALMSVSDTGTGMTKETMDKIFEPFYTTKEVGKGTGLGLAMVYGIVKQHKGYINVYSEQGAGTTFKLYLPMTEITEESDEAFDPGVPCIGTETILLAEDSDEVRLLTRELLEDFGYEVIEALDGADAVRQFMENRDKIHLLLFDVIMPKKNGKDAYEQIRSTAPDIKVLFLSGYPADVIRRRGILEKGFDVVIKPVSPNALLKKVRELLDK